MFFKESNVSDSGRAACGQRKETGYTDPGWRLRAEAEDKTVAREK